MWSHRNVTDRHVGRGRWSEQSVTIIVNMSERREWGSETEKRRVNDCCGDCTWHFGGGIRGCTCTHARTQQEHSQKCRTGMTNQLSMQQESTWGLKGRTPRTSTSVTPPTFTYTTTPSTPASTSSLDLFFAELAKNLQLTSLLSLMGMYKMLSVRTSNHLHWNKQQLSYLRMWSHLERIKLSEWLLKTNPRCKIESKSERLAWRETLKTKRLSGPGLAPNSRIWNVSHMSTWERANRSP